MHYKGSTYPVQHRDSFFYGDYSRGKVWTIATDTTGRLTRGPESNGFAGDAGAAVAFQTGPNGDITFADLLTGKVRRLVYAEGNRAPVANFGSTSDPLNRTLTFSAADSYDLDGDADVLLGLRRRHHGERAETPDARTYAAGDFVGLSAQATDLEDSTVGITWNTSLLPCPFPGCHLQSGHRHHRSDLHPRVHRPRLGHHMLVTVRATDSKGASATATYEAKLTLRILSVTSPVAVQLNRITASSLPVVAGSTVQVNVPQASAYRQFVNWSDGGAAAHTLASRTPI